MMKKYTNAEAEIVRLDGADVLTSSGELTVCNFNDAVEDAGSFNDLFGIR